MDGALNAEDAAGGARDSSETPEITGDVPPAKRLRDQPVVAMTGGLASGKTTAAQAFEALGIPCDDTDQLARRVLEPGQPAVEAVVAAFGEALRDGAGGIDRDRLRARVAADPAALDRLEAILHPAIWRAAVPRLIDRLRGAPYAILIVPLLIESGWQDRFPRVLVVDTPERLQRSRAAARAGWTGEQIEALMARQVSRSTRRAQGDDILDNAGSEGALQTQVQMLDRFYRDYFAAFV